MSLTSNTQCTKTINLKYHHHRKETTIRNKMQPNFQTQYSGFTESFLTYLHATRMKWPQSVLRGEQIPPTENGRGEPM